MKSTNTLSYQNYKIIEIEEKIKKRKIRFRIATFVVICFCAIGYFYIPHLYTTLQDDFLNCNNSQKINSFFSKDYLKNERSINWYEENALGNSNNNYIVGIPNMVERRVLNSSLNEGEVCISDKGDLVYTEDNNSNILLSEPINEFVVSDYDVYYLSQTDEKLYRINCSDDNTDSIHSELVLDIPIERFAVLGEYFIYLDKENELFLWNTIDNTNTRVAENVNRFFLGEGFVVQNGTDIYMIDYINYQPKKIISGAILEGYDSGSIYYMDINFTEHNYVLNKYDVLSETSEIISTSEKMIRGVYCDEENIYVDTVK